MGYRDLYAKFLKRPSSRPLSEGASTQESPQPTLAKGPVQILESEKRLSECLLWRLQEEFFGQQGIAAWNQVPFYPTSNPFIAQAYADLIIAFLTDYRHRLDRDHPIYILELGAGTGCFAFYLLKELQARQPYSENLQSLKLRYIMTDFAETIVKFWEGQERLQPFREAGVLDYGIYRPEQDSSISLRGSDTTLTAAALNNPLIVIANYFFDSIRHDVFRVTEGSLQEVRLTVCRDGVPQSAPITFDQLRMVESYVPLQDNYYPDSSLNRLLEEYRLRFKEATILFPIGAFDCIRNLRQLSGDQLAVLSTDKGFTTTDYDYLEGQHQQIYSLQGGIAFMVNYHAIGRYFENEGGATFFTTDKTMPLQTTMNILVGEESCLLEQTRYVFHEMIVKRNPINYLYASQELLQPERDVRLTSYLAFLRLTNFDPVALCACGEKIFDCLEGRDRHQEASLLEVLEKVAENIYLVQPERNPYFWLGRIYYGLGLQRECIEMFRQSEKHLGPDEQSRYYLAVSAEAKGDYDLALRYYKQALSADSTSQYARDGVRRVAEFIRSLP
jgi:tetratricopeptide (TPR) repeat protein